MNIESFDPDQWGDMLNVLNTLGRALAAIEQARAAGVEEQKAQQFDKAVEALREIKTLAAGAYGSRAGEHTRIKNIASAFLTTLDKTGDAT